MPSYPTETEFAPVVKGVPIMSAAAHIPEPLDVLAHDSHDKVTASACAALQQLDGWPAGLCASVAQSTLTHPLRITILDNSGSMRACDGKKLMMHAGQYHKIGCTRWEELTEDAVELARMAEALDARTEFHLLNPVAGFSRVAVGGASASAPGKGGATAPREPAAPAVSVGALKRMLEGVTPGNTTPLTQAVQRVIDVIRPKAPQLRAEGRAVAVLIVTDGLPDDAHSFVAAMRELQALPVWCVVRPCTDQESVISYWSELDRSLEAPLEVLDDVFGEAREVGTANAWLTYGPPLHHARLFGLRDTLFDALDEVTLRPAEVRRALGLLLGGGELPEPELDLAGFLEAVRVALREQPLVYDPRGAGGAPRKPWVDLRLLERALTPGVGCTVGVSNGKAVGCAIM